jgi:hypothetical protein
VELGRLFRKKFAGGLRRLGRSGKLKLDGEWSKLLDPQELKAWLGEITKSDWNVFIEGPPHGKSRPERVLKYLARYLTGGPIADSRIVSDENNKVTFLARSKSKAKNKKSKRPRKFTLPGKEFVRRWAMHILPKGYTRSRQFGGFHGSKRIAYLEQCQSHLASSDSAITTLAAPTVPPILNVEPSLPRCPRCDIAMARIEQTHRPSWKLIFNRRIYEDNTLYSPMHHIGSRSPLAFPVDEYG